MMTKTVLIFRTDPRCIINITHTDHPHPLGGAARSLFLFKFSEKMSRSSFVLCYVKYRSRGEVRAFTCCKASSCGLISLCQFCICLFRVTKVTSEYKWGSANWLPARWSL